MGKLVELMSDMWWHVKAKLWVPVMVVLLHFLTSVGILIVFDTEGRRPFYLTLESFGVAVLVSLAIWGLSWLVFVKYEWLEFDRYRIGKKRPLEEKWPRHCSILEKEWWCEIASVVGGWVAGLTYAILN